jgi:DUF2892 family protein
MKKNIGSTDSFIRFFLGVSFIINIYILKLDLVWSLVLLIAGVAMLMTAYMKFCSLYVPFKINTSEYKESVDELVEEK